MIGFIVYFDKLEYQVFFVDSECQHVKRIALSFCGHAENFCSDPGK